MSWISLITAGLFETLGVFMIQQLNQKKNAKSLLLLILFFAISFALLSYAMREIEMSTAYAIWTGIGATGATIGGMLFFQESKSILRISFIMMIIAATIGLKLVS